MFDIGWSEMAVIMLVALVVIGPKDLPRLARTLGQWVAKGRAMAREFQRSLEDMAREAELDDVKREIEKVGRTDIKRSIEKTIDPTGELGRAFDPNSRKAPPKATGAVAANGGAIANGQAPPNGEAKANPKSELASERVSATGAETSARSAGALSESVVAEAPDRQEPAPKPKADARAKPKPRAKPKSATGSDAAETPKGTAKPKAAGGTTHKSAPKSAAKTPAPESADTESVAEPS